MAAVSTGFALLLSMAVLSGSFAARQQIHQPSFSTQLRELRGTTTADLDAQDDEAPGYDTVNATLLANQAAEQTHEMAQAIQTERSAHRHGTL